MTSARIISKYILSISKPEVGDIISNLKLQKLLYYCQGFHLALYNEPLFPEVIEKWHYGPAVPEIYSLYKKYKGQAIPSNQWKKLSEFIFLSKDKIDLIGQVYNNYGQFSAWKLVEMTHNETPWKDTKIGEVITHKKLKSYFKTCLEDV